MSHEALVQIAAASAGAKPIEPFLPRHISERRWGGLMKAIARGQGLAPDRHPRPLRRVSRRPSSWGAAAVYRTPKAARLNCRRASALTLP